jgi:hypothetical protein
VPIDFKSNSSFASTTELTGPTAPTPDNVTAVDPDILSVKTPQGSNRFPIGEEIRIVSINPSMSWIKLS